VSRDLLNLALHPLGMALRAGIGLVLKGTVDQVRRAVRRAKIMPIRGVEIAGLEAPEDPSCAFLAERPDLRYARIAVAPLADITTIEALVKLECLALLRATRGQRIPIDLAALPELQRLDLDWFDGAESAFRMRRLQSFGLSNCPLSMSASLAQLTMLRRLRLADCALREIDALRPLGALTWVALHHLDKLTDFSGLSCHPAVRFLWIEGCRDLADLRCLEGLGALETLRILDCGEIGGIEALRSLPRLRHIHIHGSTRVVASGMAFLREMPQLESVFIAGMPREEAAYWTRRNRKYPLLRADLQRPAIVNPARG